MKVVINCCYGGFQLSQAAYEFLGLGWDGYGFEYRSYDMRTDPDLVKCVETLGSKKASGRMSNLKVIEVPDDVDWDIGEYDGKEYVEEKHRVWC